MACIFLRFYKFLAGIYRDVNNVQTFRGMFDNAVAFNSDIGSWDVSGCGVLSRLFAGALKFNQNISAWNVSNV
jgi:Mycoplasma protein of unknown function, DUF285